MNCGRIDLAYKIEDLYCIQDTPVAPQDKLPSVAHTTIAPTTSIENTTSTVQNTNLNNAISKSSDNSKLKDDLHKDTTQTVTDSTYSKGQNLDTLNAANKVFSTLQEAGTALQSALGHYSPQKRGDNSISDVPTDTEMERVGLTGLKSDTEDMLTKKNLKEASAINSSVKQDNFAEFLREPGHKTVEKRHVSFTNNTVENFGTPTGISPDFPQSESQKEAFQLQNNVGENFEDGLKESSAVGHSSTLADVIDDVTNAEVSFGSSSDKKDDTVHKGHEVSINQQNVSNEMQEALNLDLESNSRAQKGVQLSEQKNFQEPGVEGAAVPLGIKYSEQATAEQATAEQATAEQANESSTDREPRPNLTSNKEETINEDLVRTPKLSTARNSKYFNSKVTKQMEPVPYSKRDSGSQSRNGSFVAEMVYKGKSFQLSKPTALGFKKCITNSLANEDGNKTEFPVNEDEGTKISEDSKNIEDILNLDDSIKAPLKMSDLESPDAQRNVEDGKTQEIRSRDNIDLLLADTLDSQVTAKTTNQRKFVGNDTMQLPGAAISNSEDTY
ncbi:hypothetical protein EB796_024696 [Bugula neritina]|uniref:Uncharacterized protein n=1 Tax=Bugula neritina TaxID=10212 RepID=A0A7J7IT41_BUGNE|nr:hypothetical protein EB796_024696 [Bugula neritina]